MVRGYLCYALCLGGAAAFYLFYPGYLSFFTLILILALPLLSLLLTLPLWRRCRLTATPSAAAAVRGEAVSVRLSLAGPLTGERLIFTYRTENLLYPQVSEKVKLRLTPGAGETVPLPTQSCGWVKLTPQRCVLLDWLGLFPLPISLPQPILVLITPQQVELPPHLDFSPKPGAPLRPRPGGGPGEDYELRPYRPGDPVHAIHWKLTAKQPQEEPILRETLEPVLEHLALCYGHFGPPEELDGVLDQLYSLSRSLTAQARPFTLCWTDPASGAVIYYEVDCPKAWDSCYRALAAQGAPSEGTPLSPDVLPLPGHPGAVRWVRLAPEEVRPQ